MRIAVGIVLKIARGAGERLLVVRRLGLVEVELGGRLMYLLCRDGKLGNVLRSADEGDICSLRSSTSRLNLRSKY